MEVRRKIRRSYGESGNRTTRRGYLAGESPYAAELRSKLDRLTVVRSNPVELDWRQRTVWTRSGQRIAYERLIACIPVKAVGRAALDWRDADTRGTCLFHVGETH